jgi:hypothetical protein
MLFSRAAAILTLVSLSACYSEPILMTDNEAAFEESYTTLLASLNTRDQRKFNSALEDIVFIEVEFYGPLYDARYSTIDKDGTLGTGFAGMIKGAFSAGWADNRATIVVNNAKALLDGLTAEEIIELAHEQKKTVAQKALTLYADKLGDAEKQLVEEELAREAEKKAIEAERGIVRKVNIFGEKYHFAEVHNSEKQALSFNVTNSSEISLRSLSLEAAVHTPGRSIPWSRANFAYSLPGGLEPGETRDVMIIPSWFTNWNVPIDRVVGSVLTLNLKAVEGANEVWIGREEDTGEGRQARVEALQSAVAEIKEKMQQLRAQASAS